MSETASASVKDAAGKAGAAIKKAGEWTKKNPVIMLALLGGVLFMFLSGRKQTQPQADFRDVGASTKIRGQAFPQPFDRGVATPTEATTPNQITVRTLTADREQTGLRDQRDPSTRLDYNVLGSVAYREQLARAHARMQVGTPDREVRGGLIRTVAHGFQTPEEIMERQRVRFDRQMQAGRIDLARKVKQETELAIGQRTGW